jgi:nitrite reductase (NADH) large subunit
VGIDAVRTAVLEHTEALLERYRIAKAAADPDPWRERHAPVHPRQFAELDS